MRKFEDIIDLEKGWEILSNDGFHPISKICKTIPYEEWTIRTTSFTIKCADTHIVFDENNNEVFVKDLQIGDKIITMNGLEQVLYVYNSKQESNMYDVEVLSEEHSYLSNGILSHNTTVTVCFLLWFALFNEDKEVCLLANKGAQAREIMARIQLAYTHLPKWLQSGVTSYNKSSIELENGCKVIAAATSSDAVRGRSFACVTGDTKITILDDNGHIWYDNIKNANSSKYTKECVYDGEYMYYYVYKIINKINNKEYIGFHSTNNLDDGYMGSGKALIRAVEKYGIENFEKTILEMFDTKEAALQREAELVNQDYVNREDTYNMTIGGNVCILYGENNGFYGKHHTQETIDRIQKNSQWYYDYCKNNNRYEDDDVIINGVRYWSYNDAYKKLKLSVVKLNNLLLEEGNGFVDKERQEKHIQKMKERKEQQIINEEIRREKLRNRVFTEETRQKMSMASKQRGVASWIDKINKNPEKIRKTAEKHRGMKRSDEAKTNMSLAQKGKMYIHNPTTLELKRIPNTEPIPDGWVKGGLTKEMKELKNAKSSNE